MDASQISRVDFIYLFIRSGVISLLCIILDILVEVLGLFTSQRLATANSEIDTCDSFCNNYFFCLLSYTNVIFFCY